MPKDPLRILRARARKVNREQHAMFALLQRTTTTEYEEFRRNEEFIRAGLIAELQRFVSQCSAKIAVLRKKLGVSKAEDLRVIFEDLSGGPPGTLLYMTAGHLLKICKRYAEVIPDIAKLPLHTRIGIEDGSARTEAGRYRIHLAEMQAFQDLAALHNCAESLMRGLDYAAAPAATRKMLDAACRSAVVAGYEVIESYLNGLAYDFLLARPILVTDEDERLLKEVGVKGKPRFARFREKALRYPSIVSGFPTSLLDESNCPELAYLLGPTKELRDAIVHASPNKELIELEPGKPVMLLHVGFRDVLQLSRAVVGFILKIEPAIRGNSARTWWVEDVGADNRFPESVFV